MCAPCKKKAAAAAAKLKANQGGNVQQVDVPVSEPANSNESDQVIVSSNNKKGIIQ